MRLLPVAVSLVVSSSACTPEGSTSHSATTVDADLSDTSAPSGPSALGGGSGPTDAGSAGLITPGGGGCPARADAATCSAPPAVVAQPSPPDGAPPIPIPGYWVGCEFTSCTSATACTTCSCVDADGGGAWECASNSGFQPETDAQPTPYCALNSGPLDADIADIGPVEQCTPQYPTCTGPYPESPGWQCCLVSTVGGLTEIQCMPNDAGAYSGGLHP